LWFILNKVSGEIVGIRKGTKGGLCSGGAYEGGNNWHSPTGYGRKRSKRKRWDWGGKIDMKKIGGESGGDGNWNGGKRIQRESSSRRSSVDCPVQTFSSARGVEKKGKRKGKIK